VLESMTLQGALSALQGVSVSPASLAVEITEHERVNDLPSLIAAANTLRGRHAQLALDDFGDGRSSLRLWAELRPEYVKIDKYFLKDIDSEAYKVQSLKGLLRFAETFGTIMVAEGI
jgi:EAL domain-containing protein (putative c-di-GMP-specific phosphodiesterase class I)